MRSERDIERALKQADLDVDVNTRTDRTIESELVDLHHKASRHPSANEGTFSQAWLGYAALAAVVLIAIVTVLAIRRDESTRPEEPPQSAGMMSAAEMLTVGQLKAAYQRGGLSEVEAQCEKAAEKVDVNSEELSMGKLIVELEDR
jgi:hypothetical protein